MTDGSGDYVELRGERVLLRDPLPSDTDARLRWLTTEVEWGEWDTPWEGSPRLAPERVEEARRSMMEDTAKPQPVPRERLFIQAVDGPLLGWVIQYQHDTTARSVCIGIDICEPDYWGRGLGTEALTLWIDYLFRKLSLERIGMSTWSGNERMVRVAQNCGFKEEERLRGAREVQGKRYDLVRFVLFKRDWEACGSRNQGGTNGMSGS